MKKIISLLLVLSLVIAMSVPAFAGEDDSKGLKEAILAVRQVVEIPESYADFSYYTYESESEFGTGTIYNLSWYDDENYSSIFAVVDWNGNLITYEKFISNEEEGLAKYSRTQAAETARDFLTDAIPDYAGNMREINREDSQSYAYGHNFQYGYYFGEIPVHYITVSVRVDKYTGEVASYGGLSAGFEIPEFPDTAGVIGIEESKEAFLKEIGVSLSYYSNYDYENKTLTVFPAYHVSNDNMAIDAKTGKAVNLYFGGTRYAGGMDESANDMGGMGGYKNLSKEEIEAVEKLIELLSKDEAVKIIRDLSPINIKTSEVLSTSLREDTIDEGTYIWDISFEDAYGSIDARTGELLNLSCYGSADNGRRNLTEEAAKKVAEAFLEKVTPDKFAECEYYEKTDDYRIYNTNEDDIVYYSFDYKRQVNGINFINNGLSVTVNRKTGKVNYYNNNWYSKAEFPSLDNVISEKDIMMIMADEGGYCLAYQRTGETGDVMPVYDFKPVFKGVIYNPNTGERIDYNGEPYKTVIKPDYSDINGHWCESTILELMDNGYYLQGETFSPDADISQLGFFRYLYTPELRYYNDDELYQMLVSNKIINEEEKAPTKGLTRQEAAKFAVRYLGLGLAGEHPEIYGNLFKDKVESGYKGYASLCYGLNIMRGDERGRFNGAEVLTNAEAASVIFNILKLK